MSRNNRGNNYYNNNKDRDFYRSREKNNNWRRDKNNQGREDRNWKSNNKANYHNDQRNRNHNRYNNYSQDKVIREVTNVPVQNPQQFTICQIPVFIDQTKPKFTLNIIKNSHPPVKASSEADQLKNKITPIQKVWASHIKQYLNDSQFVQIHRKGKSLAYGEVQYGKTIINYDQGDKYMHYQNETSQSKVFSRAYFKIWEILCMKVFENKQNKCLNIASVAQGPGGFIHALIDYRLKHAPDQQDKYYAITLKIDENTRNAKDWSDFRAKTHFDQMRDIGYKIKLSYGKTKTGDLLKQQNIDYFADDDLQGDKCFLVTGDGGIQCIGDKQFDYQEVFNVKLFLGQFITALKVQQVGGKLILKIYDCSFQLTKQFLSLLCVFYKKVRIVKPVTSRPGNSQKYMLCQEFLGITKQQQASLKELLKKWTEIEPNLSYFENKQFVTNILDFSNFKNYKKIKEALQNANKFFLQEQIDKLKQGLKLADDSNGNYKQIEQILKEKRYKQQMGYAYNWCRKYGISPVEVNIQENLQQDKKVLKKQQKIEQVND